MVREHGWICLHYLFFYFMNDYRSTFYGVNDHEADWEQVFIYLEDAPDGPQPVWIAAAAHDYTGDELRRRWDDPTLAKDGDHPVINAGAGSHASYFERGEYLTRCRSRHSAAWALPRRAARVLARHAPPARPRRPARRARARSASPSSTTPVATAWPSARARRRLDARAHRRVDDWVDGYRGLFGLDTHDRFAGERAPAGPKYKRTGTVRQSWNDPLGFAGLDKSAPPFRRPG